MLLADETVDLSDPVPTIRRAVARVSAHHANVLKGNRLVSILYG